MLEGSGPRGPEDRRDTCPTLRRCPGNSTPARGDYAAANEDRGWRKENGETRLRGDSCTRSKNFAGKARVFDIPLWRATGMPVSELACRSRLSRAGSETGAPSRHDWRVAGNRRRMGIRCVDASGGANQGAGAGGGLCLGGWQTSLWYQGRSRVVPEWCRGGKGVQGALLSIAKTYASRPQATLKPGTSQVQARGLGPALLYSSCVALVLLLFFP
jgi:hypothetical protein